MTLSHLLSLHLDIYSVQRTFFSILCLIGNFSLRYNYIQSFEFSCLSDQTTYPQFVYLYNKHIYLIPSQKWPLRTPTPSPTSKTASTLGLQSNNQSARKIQDLLINPSPNTLYLESCPLLRALSQLAHPL